MQPLTDKELSEFAKYAGRNVATSISSPLFARTIIKLARRDSRIAKRYSKRVWAKYSLPEYLLHEAQKCAAFASERFINGVRSVGRTFLLENPHGTRYPELGMVHFRDIDQPFLDALSEKGESCISPCLSIERIELHPSLQRKGFLKALMEELAKHGFKMLTLNVVANPSWAYYLHQKSLRKDSPVILLTSETTVDFDTKFSPCPSFAVRLGSRTNPHAG